MALAPEHMKNKGLGRDFWLYRSGQLVSIVGDSCGMIALSWWILEATGSAAKMSSIIAPAMFARVILAPLLAPLGDRLRRKNLIIAGDLWRGVLYLALAAMAASGAFQLWLILSLYMLSGAGSALFSAGASGIVPSLVSRDDLQLAMQRTEAVNSVGQILGGAAGGLLVTAIGVPGALLLDSLSYFAAAAASRAIKADTMPTGVPAGGSALKNWAREFSGGVSAMGRVPVMLGIGIVAAFINFAFAPIAIGLPVLVKELRNMPPWYLGAMESALSVGAILGSFAVGRLTRRLGADKLMVGGIMLLGVYLALLPVAPDRLAPLLIMLLLGSTMSVVNIPLNVRCTAAMPDNYRARMGGAMGFLCGVMAPLGVAAAGAAIAAFGLPYTFLISGIAAAALGPLLLLVPDFRQFLRLNEQEADGYFLRRYPSAFR